MPNTFDTHRGTLVRLAIALRLCAVLAVAAMVAGCSQPTAPSPRVTGDRAGATSTAGSAINTLLRRYGLHRARGSRDVTESAPVGGPGYDLLVTASRRVGLDLAPYHGRTLDRVSVTLEEQSQSSDASGSAVAARFFVDGERVVGAALTVPGYYPGVGALQDHQCFAVPGFAPGNLDFRGVRSVRLLGPYAGREWSRDATLSAGQARELAAMLGASELRSAERHGTLGDEEYMIVLTWGSGAEIRARLVTERRTGQTIVTYDLPSLFYVHYLPPVALKSLVTAALSGGG
jgi:hypothetical protein